MRRGRRPGGEEGLTLVELLVTVAIMGIAFVVLVGGLGTAIIGSDVHRKQADVETVLRSFAEAVKGAEYVDCASADQYEQVFSAPQGYTADVTGIAFAPPPYNAFVESCSRGLLQPATWKKTDPPTQFRDPSNALVIGESPTPLTADATLAPVSAPSASLTLTDYLKTPIPADARIDRVGLRVAHADGPGVGRIDVAVKTDAVSKTLSTGDRTGACTSLCLHEELREDYVDLTADLGEPSKFANLEITYTTVLAPATLSATDALDGIWLEVDLAGPDDGGLQRVTLQVRADGGRAEQSLDVVIRDRRP